MHQILKKHKLKLILSTIAAVIGFISALPMVNTFFTPYVYFYLAIVPLVYIFFMEEYYFYKLLTKVVGRRMRSLPVLLLGIAIVLAGVSVILYLTPLIGDIANRIGVSQNTLYLSYLETAFELIPFSKGMISISGVVFGVFIWDQKHRVELKSNSTSIKRKAEIPHNAKNSRSIFKSSWVIFFVVGIFITFAFHHLGQFLTVDEPKWLFIRVPQLLYSLTNGDWMQTYINDKPGVLPAILASVIHLFTDVSQFDTANVEKFLVFWRIPLIIFNASLLFIIWRLLLNLVDRKATVLVMILLALNPFIIGHTQIVNPDSTLWSVGFASMISYFIYLKDSNRKYLMISAIFLALGLLSKHFITLLYLFYPLGLYLRYLYTKDKAKYIYGLWDLGWTFILTFVIFFITFPVNWVLPTYALTGSIGSVLIRKIAIPVFGFICITLIDIVFHNGDIFSKRISEFLRFKFVNLLPLLVVLIAVLYVVTNKFSGNVLFDPQNYFWFEHASRRFNPLDLLQMNINITVLTTPLVVLALICITFWRSYRGQYDKDTNYILHIIFIFIIIFILGATAQGYIASPRYQILFLPLYGLLAGFAFHGLKISFRTETLLTAIIFICSLAPLLTSTPFYILYTNTINYDGAFSLDSWGMGGYEVVKELEEDLGDLDNITIWFDREGIELFYPGPQYWRSSANPFDPAKGVDYLLLSLGGERIYYKALESNDDSQDNLIYNLSRYSPILEYYEKEPDYIVCVGPYGKNCLKVVKLQEEDRNINIYDSNSRK